MPKDSRVGKAYDAMRRGGMPPAKAAKIAQTTTRQALMTGKTPKTGPMSHSGGKKR